jgi:hypothetical protein
MAAAQRDDAATQAQAIGDRLPLPIVAECAVYEHDGLALAGGERRQSGRRGRDTRRLCM